MVIFLYGQLGFHRFPLLLQCFSDINLLGFHMCPFQIQLFLLRGKLRVSHVYIELPFISCVTSSGCKKIQGNSHCPNSLRGVRDSQYLRENRMILSLGKFKFERKYTDSFSMYLYLSLSVCVSLSLSLPLDAEEEFVGSFTVDAAMVGGV